MTAATIAAQTGTRISLQVGVSEDALALAYLLLKQADLLEEVFPGDEIGILDFIGISKKVITLGAYEETEIGSALLGIGWLERDGHRGMCGMAFLPTAQRERWRLAKCLEASRLMLDWAFEQPGLEVLYGKVPVAHRRAVIFAKLVGFQQIGPLPLYQSWRGVMCDSWMMALTKDRWRSLKRRPRFGREQER